MSKKDINKTIEEALGQLYEAQKAASHYFCNKDDHQLLDCAIRDSEAASRKLIKIRKHLKKQGVNKCLNLI